MTRTHNDRTKRAKVTELWHLQGNRMNFSLVVTTSKTFVEMTCFLFLGLWTLHYFCVSYKIQLYFIFSMHVSKMKKVKSKDKRRVLQGTCEGSVCCFCIVRDKTVCIIYRTVMSAPRGYSLYRNYGTVCTVITKFDLTNLAF